MQGSLVVEIDPSKIPPGPAGKNNYELWLEDGNIGSLSDFLEWMRANQVPSSGGILLQHIRTITPAGVVTSYSSSPVGVYRGVGAKVTITPSEGNTVRIEARGTIGHTDPEAIIHFSLKRNGVDIVLPAGVQELTAVRSQNSDYVYPFYLDFEEEASGSIEYEYELTVRLHGGSAHIGKRPGDNLMSTQTVMIAEEYAA